MDVISRYLTVNNIFWFSVDVITRYLTVNNIFLVQYGRDHLLSRALFLPPAS